MRQNIKLCHERNRYMKIFKFHRHRGAALLNIVLISFVLFGILSAAAIVITMNTIKIETWQREHYEDQRLMYLSQSTAIATGTSIQKHLNSDNRYRAVNKSGKITAVDPEKKLNTEISVEISGEEDASFITIKVTAENQNGKKAFTTCYYNRETDGLFGWEVRDVEQK